MSSDPLTPGLRDELVTKSLLRQLNDRAIAHETDKLLASDAAERLGRHLLEVSRRLRVKDHETEISEAIGLVNDAITALGPEFSDDQLAVPGQVLSGILTSRGLAEPLPARPAIPLSTSELLVNGSGQPTLGAVLKEEIRCATHVDLICAFVGWGGVVDLLDDLRGLLERGGRLRVITSTYLGSTNPKALDALVSIGAEVRVNYDGSTTKLHAKSWLFWRPAQLDTAFVGSSNLSEAALHTGLEWNVRLARADAPAVFSRMASTFDSYWHAVAYEPYSLEDRARLEAALLEAKGYAAQGHGRLAQKEIDLLNRQLEEAYAELAIRPRPHQQLILDQLALRRSEFDEHRHLVVAATGTGKTVIAAFDYARLCQDGQPRPRLLFVAHREQILRQARKTFRQVLRDPSFGEVLGGSSRPIAGDRHVFAMIQTLHNRLGSLEPDAYNVIYVDEAHHGTAETWQAVIQHFEPHEIVGLTATPERTDGGSVADLFGGEYTAELRLWEAVDDQLLAPFVYYGIDDGTDLRHLGWHGGDYAVGELAELYTGDHERVKRVVEGVHRLIADPARMRALGFCVNKAHAEFMAEQFAGHGFKADFLTGDHDQAHRDSVLSKLKAGQLQAVFSVEVLGEGVDLPDVDTLLLLRPTQSPVLFAQQLGRGLRKAPLKPCCTVLDFIGQHRKEYRFDRRFEALIDQAHGSVREQAEQEFPFLPAGCAINLERVARERVLAALKAASTSPGVRAMVAELKRLESTTLEEFLRDSERTASQLYAADGRKLSWTRLQRGAGLAGAPAPPEDASLLTLEADLLRRIGYLQHVADSLRVDTWMAWLAADAAPVARDLSSFEQRLAVQLLHLLQQTPSTLQEGFDVLWQLPAVRIEICQLLKLDHAHLDAVPLPLQGLSGVPLLAHARYTRAEVFGALGISAVDRQKEHREGVYFSHDLKTQLMFVTLHKDEKRYAPSVQYRDHALAADLFHWESPNNWRRRGAATQRCIGVGDDGSNHRLLFVREGRSGAVASTFRFFGEVDLDGDLDGERPVAMTWRLRQPLPELAFEATRLVAAG